MTEPAQKTFMGMLFILIVLGLLAWTMQPALPAWAGNGLPPRDPPIPRPADQNAGDNDGGAKGDRLVGAYIELHLSTAPAEAWAVVQWQDSAGGWHDVEGWRGSPGPAGGQRWWVAARDFGQGPFRWVVTRGPGGALLGTSQPFYLPTEANQVVPIHLAGFDF